MSIYIQGIGAITIQETFLKSFAKREPIGYNVPHVRCIDPLFKEYLDPLAARRMSRIIKRAVLSADKAMYDAGIEMPDAIISGTGLGCVEDTEKFLDAMVRHGEHGLQPSNFIQSTHNTISSQIAIRKKCNGYNNTHVHKSVSFESALLEAYLLFHLRRVKSVLVGGYDEMTPSYYNILGRINYWRQSIEDTLRVVQVKEVGSFAGEGSISFMLSDNKTELSLAELNRVELFYKPEKLDVALDAFLQRAQVDRNEIDAVFVGRNGDRVNDAVYENGIERFFDDSKIAYYKPFCGEYFTATAFGMMLGAECLKQHVIPACYMASKRLISKPQYVLIYNHSENKNHSFILLSSCGN